MVGTVAVLGTDRQHGFIHLNVPQHIYLGMWLRKDGTSFVGGGIYA